MIHAAPGDLLLVRRRRTWRSFFSGPVSWIISRRIQVLTDSRWNHVAIFVTPAMLIEAHWSGVRQIPLIEYKERQREVQLSVARCPAEDRNAIALAVVWLRQQLGDRYDGGLIWRMRWAAIWDGVDGIRKIQQKMTDDEWICSELAQQFWMRCGVRGGPWNYPGAYEKFIG